MVEDLREFRVHTVIKDGRVAARTAGVWSPGPPRSFAHANTVRLRRIDRGDVFFSRLPMRHCPVIEIVPDQIVTRRGLRSVRLKDGTWCFDPERDVLLIASIERHKASGSDRAGTGQWLRSDETPVRWGRRSRMIRTT